MLRVESPFSGDVVCEVARDDTGSLEAKLSAARNAQRVWRGVAVAERARRVAAGLSFFRELGEDIARDVTMQTGKPLRQSRAEVAAMIDRAEHMVAIAEKSLAADVLPAIDGFHRRIEHVPHGVVLDLAAWNYPLLIAVNVVVPALLAGNAVLIKHSARTPLCAEHFVRAFAGLEPAGLVHAVVLDHRATGELVADPRIDHVAFTGSVEGGRAILQHARHRFVEVGLELGGADPAYVAADADLPVAVDGIVDGACYNAGQSCCAVERVYVARSRYEEFLERAAEVVARYRLGDPLSEDTTMGPLISAAAVKFVDQQVQAAIAAGARLLHGGAPADRGRFYAPTLLADCPDDSDVMCEETFGPVVAVRAVDGDDEALALMNHSRFGLTASVWTAARERAEFFAARLETGTVFQNRCDFLDPGLPWTGVKDSGMGATLSRYGLLQLTRRKSIHFRD